MRSSTVSPNKTKSQSSAKSSLKDAVQSPSSSKSASANAPSNASSIVSWDSTHIASTIKPKTISKAKPAKKGKTKRGSRISTHQARMVHQVERDQVGNIAYGAWNEQVIRKKAKYRVFYNNIARDAHMKGIPGTLAKEIRKMMGSYGLLIPRLSFARVCKEVMQHLGYNGRVTSLALQALQEAAEDMLVQMFREVNTISANSRRMTILPRDLNALKELLHNRGITL